MSVGRGLSDMILLRSSEAREVVVVNGRGVGNLVVLTPLVLVIGREKW